MARSSVRPVTAFVLRVWREPGAHEENGGWRGSIRPLSATSTLADETEEKVFHGLENLPGVLRSLLDVDT